MDPQLSKIVDAAMPETNEDLCNGLVVKHLADVEQFIDDVIRCAAGGFPADLEYVGYVRCTPQEQFEELTRYRNDRFVYELARTDTYMVKYQFKWKGKELPPKKINLPYVNDGGLMHINGVIHAISPVLADPLFSIGPGEIYVPLTRAKLTFNRIQHPFFADGKRTGAYVVWSSVHNSAGNKNAKSRPSVPAHPALVGYLLAKYGLSETLAKVGIKKYACGYASEINIVNYPEKDWVICGSATNLRHGTKLKAWIREKIARDGIGSVGPSQVLIAIPRKVFDGSTVISSIIAGVFYMIDHFPDRVEPEYVDQTTLWRILLGHINYPYETGEPKMVVRIEAH